MTDREEAPQGLEEKLKKAESSGGKAKRPLDSFKNPEVLTQDGRGRPLRVRICPMDRTSVWVRASATDLFELESESRPPPYEREDLPERCPRCGELGEATMDGHCRGCGL